MTREHLLAAAAQVFADRGYQRATLDEVAEAAGFTKGAVYSNFSSKEELFLALAQQRDQQLIDAFSSAARTDLDTAALVASLRNVYAGTDPALRDQSWRLWQEFTLHALRDERSRQKLIEEQRAGFALVVDLVKRQCADAGVEPPLSAELIARIYIALFNGLWTQQAIDPDAVDDDAFAEAVVFVGRAIEALGAPAPPRRAGRTKAAPRTSRAASS